MMFYKRLLHKILRMFAKWEAPAYTKTRTSEAMSELNKHFETVKTPLIAAGITSAVGMLTLKMDRYLGHRSITDESGSNLDFFVHEKPGGDTTFVLLGGLCMAGEYVAKQFDSELMDGVNMVSPIYASNGFNKELLFDRLYDEVEKTNPDTVKVGGLSMGGKLVWDWLAYGLETGRQETVEKVATVVVRGVPTEPKAIRPAPRMLLSTVSRRGYSYALDHGRPLLKRWNCVSLLEASPVTIAQQCHYLASKPSAFPSILPERIIFARGSAPDPIVNEDTAIASLEQQLGRPVEQAIDTNYDKSAHVPTDRHSVRFMLEQLGIAKEAIEKQQLSLPLLRFAA